MKPLHLAFIICTSLLSCASSCGKDTDIYEEVFFEFVVPITVTPAADTVLVGQELTITCNFSDSLFDYLGRKNYYLPNFNWNSFVMLQKISDKTKPIVAQMPALNKFEIQNIIGGFTNISSSFADFTIIYEAGQYKFQAKIKPGEKGTYHLRMFYDAGRGFTPLPQSFAPNEPGRKRFPVIQRVRHTFNETDTHYEIYLQNSLQLTDSNGSTTFDRDTGYTFVVK